MTRIRFATVLCATLTLSLPTLAQAKLVFNFTNSTGNSQADAAFEQAASLWSSIFTDDVTINISRGFAALTAGLLGSTNNIQNTYTYSAGRAALVADVSSADDASAASHLQSGSALSLLINKTATNPNGSGSATPYLDSNGSANNTTLRLTNANAKALGLLAGNNSALDGSITFSSSYAWDFNPADGITWGTHDFVGAATHELGHILGFMSGVDVLDRNSPPVKTAFNENLFTYISPLDLYRYSSQSYAYGSSIIDWTVDSRTKYFSIDGGANSLGIFADGANSGDGRQASHWKDNLGLGIMDPSAANGEKITISALDIRALDVIGWNLTPEPPMFLLIGLAGLAARKARRRYQGVNL